MSKEEQILNLIKVNNGVITSMSITWENVPKKSKH